MILFLVQQLGIYCCLGDVSQILLKISFGFAVVSRFAPQNPQRLIFGQPEPLNYQLGVDIFIQQSLSRAQQLGSEHADSGCSVADLLVLCFRNVHQKFGAGVINVDFL